jgi:DNA-binding GntR family transcriptional regulator
MDPSVKRIQKLNLGDQVYQVLRQMIANYRFVPGSHLNVEELTRNMGVSRTPVWEAVRRLEQEGFVRNEPKKGVRILQLTPETALELYAVREVLEALAVRSAVEAMGKETLDEMARCLHRQKGVIRKKDLVGYSELDFEFHGTIYGSCGNRTLQELLETLKNRSRPVNFFITPILPRLYQDHVAILEALKERNADRAEKAIRDHNRTILEKIREDVTSGAWRKGTSQMTTGESDTA